MRGPSTLSDAPRVARSFFAALLVIPVSAGLLPPGGLALAADPQHVVANGVGVVDAVNTILYPCESSVASNGPNASGASDDRGFAIDVSPDGSRAYVTGSVNGEGMDADILVVAYDVESGMKLWDQTWDGGGVTHDRGYTVRATPGQVFVAGFTKENGMDEHVTLAYRADDGDLLWTQRIPARMVQEFAPLKTSPDGSLVYVSYPSDDMPDGVVVTKAHEADTGHIAWTAHHNAAATGSSEGPMEIAVSGDGSRLFVVGTTPQPEQDIFAVAYDAHSGDGLWNITYDGGAGLSNIHPLLGSIAIPEAMDQSVWEAGLDIVADTDGDRVYLTGFSGDGITNRWYTTLAYDGTGTLLWHREYTGDGLGSIAHGIALHPDESRVYVTGSSENEDLLHRTDFVTLAYNTADGSEAWAVPARYTGTGTGSERGLEILATPDGEHVVVGGCSFGDSANFDYATVVYDAYSGLEERAWRYSAAENPGDDAIWPRGLAVSPDGKRIFVTGRSDGGPATGLDVATLAYDIEAGTVGWEAREDRSEPFGPGSMPPPRAP